MVTRQSSPNFFLRYQALIRPPGPPPTIARSSIDSCYLPVTFPPAYGDPPTRNLPSPPCRVPDGARSGKAKIPSPLQRFRAPIRRFRPPRGELRLRRPPPSL